MDHGIIHTWPIFTIRTGINTHKCVRRKIQHFTPSNLCAHWWIHYNYITIIPKVGNTMYDVYSRQNTQEIQNMCPCCKISWSLVFMENKLVPVCWWVKSLFFTIYRFTIVSSEQWLIWLHKYNVFITDFSVCNYGI
jgi:hypothetical protein